MCRLVADWSQVGRRLAAGWSQVGSRLVAGFILRQFLTICAHIQTIASYEVCNNVNLDAGLTDGHTCFIGLTDAAEEGLYVWSDGSSLDYTQ